MDLKELEEWERELKEFRKTYLSEVLMRTPIEKAPDEIVNSLIMSSELDRVAKWFQKNCNRNDDWYRVDNYKRHRVALQTYISLLQPEKKWTSCYSGQLKNPTSPKKEDFEFVKIEIWLVNPEKY